jgi:hypothetical protein
MTSLKLMVSASRCLAVPGFRFFEDFYGRLAAWAEGPFRPGLPTALCSPDEAP